MATTKTLTPTNQTITIDAFQGEKPDHRHVADAETKLADAVNALNSQLFTNKADTTLINLVKTFNVGTYNFRLDNATDGPVSSGGVVYKVVKTHGTNDTRCSIIALPMASNTPVYSAFVGQNATSITWSQIVTTSNPWGLHGLSESNSGVTASDLNSCDYAGAYMFNSSTSNHPSGANYGVCFTIATSEPQNTGVGWVFQLAFATSDATKMFMRSRINNGAWSTWKSITFS